MGRGVVYDGTSSTWEACVFVFLYGGWRSRESKAGGGDGMCGWQWRERGRVDGLGSRVTWLEGRDETMAETGLVGERKRRPAPTPPSLARVGNARAS